MSTSPESKPRTRWRLLLGLAGFFFLALIVGIPTTLILVTRSQIAKAARNATAVRLEEHLADEVLTARTLKSFEFREVIDAIPITGAIGVPGAVKLCFIPHHRVIFTDAAQKEMTLEICFSCGQLQHSKEALVPVPGAWEERLRQLFLRHDVPIRERYGPGFLQEP